MENNKVKRYLCSGYDGVMIPFGVGDWVAYEDYCKLKDDFDKNNSKWYDIAVKSSTSLEKSAVHHIAELEQLKRMYHATGDALNNSISREVELRNENEKLKAKVKSMALDSLHDIGEMGEMSAENNNLKRNIERLRNAGDKMLDGWVGMYGDHEGSMAQDYIQLWNKAKKGIES